MGLLMVNIDARNEALAVSEDDKKGRYQISAWAAQSEGSLVHSGYYVLDTATGTVVASKAGIHVLKNKPYRTELES